MIVKEGDQYVVRSKTGRKLGAHKTRKGAKAQLAAIESAKAASRKK